MKIKISNSKITVAGKTVIDNRGKEDVVLHSFIKQGEQLNCELCKSIQDAKDIINFPLDCGRCGKTHTI